MADEPLQKHPSVLKTVASYIIVTEFCERLAYYGFAGSLVLFFQTKLSMSNEDSVNAFNLWNGAVYVTPLLGGYIADTYLGRYKTILAFSILYLFGLGLFILGEIPNHVKAALVFSGMYVVALGAGGIKPNCSTMGADQFDVSNPQDLKESKQFFSFFYWSINLGALGAYTLVAYTCQYGLDFLGGADWGFFVGYMIPTIVLTLGIAVFVSGSRIYKKRLPEGSMITMAVAIMWEALVSNRDAVVDVPERPTSRTSSKSSSAAAATKYLMGDSNAKISQADADAMAMDKIRANSGTEKSDSMLVTPIPMLETSGWLDRACRKWGGSFGVYQVESIKYVMRIVPFLLVQVPYWGIYGQTKTAFQIQGCQMNLDMGGFQIPVSGMNIFNNVAILILVPLFDQVVYPAIRQRGIPLKMLTRVWLGFIVAVVAMLVAALVEIARVKQSPAEAYYGDAAAQHNISPCRHLNNYNPYQYQDWANGGNVDKPSSCEQICPSVNGVLDISCISCDPIPQMSRMSVFWQIPQFVLIGISEILAVITMLEFFYSQAPLSMRSISQSCNLLTSALGSWMIIPLTILVNVDKNDMWITSNVNEGHLDYYFFLLAALMVLALIVFSILMSGFTYADPVVLEKLTELCSEETGVGRANSTGHDQTNIEESSFSPLTTADPDIESRAKDEL